MLVPIIMASASDKDHVRRIIRALEDLEIPYEVRVASAHKAAVFLLDMLRKYEEDGRAKVYITVAGRSNALSAVVDSNVTAPVIACPPQSDSFGGADIFSSLRMPSGVAPAVVLEPDGAALFAAKILGMRDEAIRARVARLHEESRERIEADDRFVGDLILEE